jgi:hypothetical protein
MRVWVDMGEYGTPSIMSTAYVEMQEEILVGLLPAWRREASIRQTVGEITRKVNAMLGQAQ